MPNRLGLVVALIAALWASAPTLASAQEQPLQASNGAALYLGSLEGVLLAGAPVALAIAASNGADFGEALACTVLLPFCALFVPDLARDVGTIFLVVLLGSAIVLAVPPSIRSQASAALRAGMPTARSCSRRASTACSRAR